MKSAEILHFPTRPEFPDAQAKRAAPAHPALRRGEIVGIHYIALKLRMPDAEVRSVVRLARAMVAANRLPSPQPRLSREGHLLEGAEAVSGSSRWWRVEIDASFDSQPTPPGVIAARQQQVDQAIADRFENMIGGRANG